jgi:hypothetical protein
MPTLLFAAVLLLSGVPPALAQSIAPPQGTKTENVGSSASAAALAAACANTLEQFVPALDGVLEENPRSILRYHAVLSKYLFLKNGIPNLPPPALDASVQGCRIEDAIKIAQRSKFLFEIGRPPRYEHYRIEFRNSVAKAGFVIDKKTGNIFGPFATWINPSL